MANGIGTEPARADSTRRLSGFIGLCLLLLACSQPSDPVKNVMTETDEDLSLASDAGDVDAKLELERRRQAHILAETEKRAAEKTAFRAAVASGDDRRIYDLADSGNPYALFFRAEERLASDDPYLQEEGRHDAEAAASAGSPDAQLWVGYRMSQGIEGYPWKPNSGLRMVEKAANQGHPQAMYVLGQIYEQSAPMQDLALAREWYARAAQAGVAEAKEALAGMNM